MPFDASDPALSVVVAPAARIAPDHRLRPLTLGVFHYDGAWKVYGEFDRAAAYPSWDLAVSAAQARADEAVSAGRPVELFIQDQAGDISRAPVGYA
jgi:hypothetical protein